MGLRNNRAEEGMQESGVISFIVYGEPVAQGRAREKTFNRSAGVGKQLPVDLIL